MTPNHWSNEEKCIEHIEKIIVPYVNAKRDELRLNKDHKALLIFDVFKGQKTEGFLACLEKQNLVAVYVPANMTRYFQPPDLTINGVAKSFLKEKFAKWYADQVTTQLSGGTEVYAIDIKMQLSALKPIHARWLISLYDHFRNQKELIKKAFEKAGINEALTQELESEDPFADIL